MDIRKTLPLGGETSSRRWHMWELAILIATVVGCVHFVHRYAFKEGHAIGIVVGRKEILEENIHRTHIMRRDNQDLMTLVAQITTDEEPRKIEYVPKEETNGNENENHDD
jgi:hypothetical protein